MPTATLRQAKSSGKLEAFRASWIADYPDAENYLSSSTHPIFLQQGLIIPIFIQKNLIRYIHTP